MLKKYRKKERKTLSYFSSLLGITKDHLWRIENNKRKPSISLALKIEKQTNGEVRVEDLIPELRERAFPVGPFPMDYSGIQEEETAGQLGQNGGQSGESAGQLYKPAGQSGQNDGQTGKTAGGKSNPVKLGKENELSENRGGER